MSDAIEDVVVANTSAVVEPAVKVEEKNPVANPVANPMEEKRDDDGVRAEIELLKQTIKELKDLNVASQRQTAFAKTIDGYSREIKDVLGASFDKMTFVDDNDFNSYLVKIKENADALNKMIDTKVLEQGHKGASLSGSELNSIKQSDLDYIKSRGNRK